MARQARAAAATRLVPEGVVSEAPVAARAVVATPVEVGAATTFREREKVIRQVPPVGRSPRCRPRAEDQP